MWVSNLPHFCGNEDCDKEGLYEVRLEQAESVWASRTERDRMLEALQNWQGGLGADPDSDWESA